MISRADLVINGPPLDANPWGPGPARIFCPASGLPGQLAALNLYGAWFIADCQQGIEEPADSTWFDSAEEALDWLVSAMNRRLTGEAPR